MPNYFISQDANKMGHVQLDGTNGSLVKMTLLPVAPNPDNMPAKSSSGGISTEWIIQHPTLPLICAFTSYGNKHPAHMTCFTVENEANGNDNDNITLTKTSIQGATAGREACHAAFSPIKSDSVTLAVAHHNDSLISFFQFSTTELPTSLMHQPKLILELPEMEPGTKHTLATDSTMGLSLPSSHFVQYSTEGDYLWVVDPNQSAIFTFSINPQTGLPADQKPTSTFQCHTDAPPLGWFGGLVATVMGLGCRPRRIALSPNQEYVFISYETRNVIQVYHVNPKTGEIDPDQKGCLQEASSIERTTLEDPLVHVGLTFQATGEMLVHDKQLYISNRGNGVLLNALSRGENSIRVFDILDGGRLANPQMVPCAGPVKHFCVYRSGSVDTLVVGCCKPAFCLQTFRRTNSSKNDNSKDEEEPTQDKFELVGNADVGVNVMCILPATRESKNQEKDDWVLPGKEEMGDMSEASSARAEVKAV